MIVNRFLWSFVVKNVSCRKYVPSKICPILLLVENMSTLLLVENMSFDNMSVENMSVEKTSRCPALLVYPVKLFGICLSRVQKAILKHSNGDYLKARLQ